MKQNWTLAQDIEAAALWAEGKSAGEIARIMGDGRSRNAVIGRLHRLGVPKRQIAHKPGREAKPVTLIKRQHRKRVWPTDPGASLPTPEVEAAPPPVLAKPRKPKAREWNGKPVPLLRLTATSCRFPVSGEGVHTLFCGHSAEAALPYCVRHVRICYQQRG